MVVYVQHRLEYGSGRSKSSAALVQTYDASFFRKSILRSLQTFQKSAWLDKTVEIDLDATNVDARSLSSKETQQHKLQSSLSTFRSSSTNALSSDRIVLGILESVSVQAFVDTCAENLITELFVRERGLSFNSDASSHVRVADGTSLPTLGIATLSWRFRDEDEPHLVRFHVIQNASCRYPIVLGGAFLWNSGTLTEHISRLRVAPRGQSSPRIFFQGSGHLRLSGICENRAVEMFPDLASDIPAMSRAFAREIGMSVDTSASSRVAVEVPGYRMIMTCGRVTDVSLRLGRDVYQQAFYLIDGLPGDILLDAEFLTRTNAFMKYRDRITVTQQMDGDGQGVFLVVKRIETAAKASKSRRWKIWLKQPLPTPLEDRPIDCNELSSRWIDRDEELRKQQMTLETKSKSETDPEKKRRLQMEVEGIKQTLEREGKEYEENYQRLRSSE